MITSLWENIYHLSVIVIKCNGIVTVWIRNCNDDKCIIGDVTKTLMSK